MQLIIQKLRS